MAPSLASPITADEGCTPTIAAGCHQRRTGYISGRVIVEGRAAPTLSLANQEDLSGTNCSPRCHPPPTDEENFPDPAKTWNPDPRVYYSRRLQQQRALHARPAIPPVLPPRFPARIDPASPLVWSGQDLVEHEYLRSLSADDIAEIEHALEHFKGLSLPIAAVGRKTFPLPELGPRIISLSNKLYGQNNGRGFFILRGLDPKKYSARDNVILYAGIASYVAERRGRQDEKNNYLLHLTDLGASVAPDNVRQAPYSNVPQPFHTDTADILALYTLRPAFRGGRSLLASSSKIYNSLAPAHIATLAAPNWAFDSFGRTPSYTLRPLLYSVPSGTTRRIQLSFSRRPLTGSPVSPRTPTIPSLTPAQSAALDTVHFCGVAHALSVAQQPGDLLFWNNFALLHAREGFQDREEPEERRHLLRLWLRDDKRAREWGNVPEELMAPWRDAFEGEGEMGVENWPVEPVREFAFVTEQRRSSGHA
ncbi:hypothetical protein BZA05DRAFT_241548 [Tricharina praecox]|uniref:uncharacterized protein n=1 Tax=Tricharina praecox TaxID=43433 RepID=UPI0022208722|nr:uncharacterized protein BZA05DRAFT_241548 [Tricharina praecox]KAI5855505.1 hypothetical protein BZA05DRAFT_241548 [Tricharina praecox]